MWRRSVYGKTLRDCRSAIVGWGVGVGLLLYAVLSAAPALAATPQARAALIVVARPFAWLAEPIKVDTPGGYATWKVGVTLLALALWPILAGSRILRGEEEQGSLDVLLALPRGRGRVALEKVGALWTALLAMGLLIALLTFAGEARAGATFGLGGAALFGLNLALIGGVFGGVALLLLQFTRERRTAAGLASGMLLLAIVVDMAHRLFPGAEGLARLSPVYYYTLSKPLVAGYGANPGALLVLLALGVLPSMAALWLFVRRDIGGVVALPHRVPGAGRSARRGRALPMDAWSLRSVYTRSLAQVVAPTAWWALAIAGLAAWMVVIVAQTDRQLTALSTGSLMLKGLLTTAGRGTVVTDATLLSALFLIVPALVMAFALSQASRWAADVHDGRLDLVLATPRPRVRVLLARVGALASATVAIAALTLALTALATATSGVPLDGGDLVAATLALIPQGLLMAALGYLAAGWLRPIAQTGLLSLVLVAWFALIFLGPDLRWPQGMLQLSAYYYYGTPLLHGLPRGETLLVAGGIMGALTLAAWRFVRTDIAT